MLNFKASDFKMYTVFPLPFPALGSKWGAFQVLSHTALPSRDYNTPKFASIQRRDPHKTVSRSRLNLSIYV